MLLNQGSMIRNQTRFRGFTIVEVFAVLMLISLLVTLLLPAVQSSREMARRTSCGNNLMQVSLAMHNYHSAFQQLPTQLSGTDGSVVAGQDNDRRLSIFVAFLPFLENAALAEQINQPYPRRSDETGPLEERYGMGMAYSMDGSSSANVEPWVAGGPEPFDWRYFPWASERSVLRCPSDPGAGAPAISRSNYAACLGDGVLAADSGPMKEVNGAFVVDPQLAAQTEAAMRGIFVPRVVTRLADVTDGLSNTIAFGELATDLGDVDVRTHPVSAPAVKLRDNPNWARNNQWIDPDRRHFWEQPPPGNVLNGNTGLRRGYRWADGMPLFTGMNTILPPNREIMLSGDRDDTWGVLSPSSRHQSGVHVAFADCGIAFISDSIDAGDANRATVYVGSPNPPGSESPFGLWGALGTRASSELRANSFASSLDFE